jgi:hypothetical protein
MEFVEAYPVFEDKTEGNNHGNYTVLDGRIFALRTDRCVDSGQHMPQ